jgi:signal transduction histidine kinase
MGTFAVDQRRAKNSSNRVLDRIVVIRVTVGLAMIFYMLFGIFAGIRIPFVKRISAYLYFAIAASVPVIYWTRPVHSRQAAGIAQFMFFTAYLLGNWTYTLCFHLTSDGSLWRGWIWLIVWVLEVYAEGALLRGRPYDPFYPATALRRYLRARENLLEELEETKSQLARVNRSLTLSALAETITHEISQPIAAIVVNAEAANRWLIGKNIEKAREAVARVVEDGHRASAVIASFRGLLKDGRPLRISVGIGDLIEQALNIHRADIESHDVNVSTRNLKSVPPIMCDPIQVRQVFLNLIANAIDALGETSSRTERDLIVSYEGIKNGQATISVEDNGRGIPNTEQIWELFFTTKAKGMGMGLFISRMVIETHGGTLTVKSSLGRTKFYVSMPIKNRRHGYDGFRSGKRQIAAIGNRELAGLGWLPR